MSIGRHALLSRAAALLILALMLGGFFLGSATAYLDFVAADAEQLDREAQLLQRYRALARETPSDEASAVGGEKALLFPQVPESQAVALLQEALKSAAATAQVEVQGLQVLRTEALPGSARIGVRLRGAGDIAGLNRLLYMIEAARPLLFPDNLQIQSRTFRSGAPSSPLEFQLDVSCIKAEPSA
jgi:general secretion pathway protein M